MSLRKLFPRRIRTRLAVLYALVFLLAGSGLLGLTYGLLAARLPATRNSKAVQQKLLTVCKRQAALFLPGNEGPGVKVPPAKIPSAKIPSTQVRKPIPPQLNAKCKQAFQAGAQDQRDQTLTTLLDASLLGLAVATLLSAGLGWIVSGRVLGPVREITETARRASELQLSERLALDGPDDELKELADTFDLMLARLDAAFASQQRFVANAAHELRTPLTAMRTAIEVTLTKPNRTEEQLAAMAVRVQRSVERAEATVEALLTLATSEAGP
ncbi:MAG TPA: histidine kinase dimerization/phospho-acceptor domain-containing protein, partial [Chloroflexota bacterium]